MASAPDTTVKVFATGLAAGIILDATIIRALLVPAVGSLFGRWNWWLPERPARMLRVEPSVPARPPRPVPEAAASGGAWPCRRGAAGGDVGPQAHPDRAKRPTPSRASYNGVV
jgi:hypothetical protein